MQITVSDEVMRRALECALWMHASGKVGGERFYDPLWDAAWELAHVGEPRHAQPAGQLADEVLEQVERARADIGVVRSAAVGASVEIASSADGLVAALDDCREAIQETGENDFWARPSGIREEMLATRDAAVRLLDELAAVEAVA